MEAAAQIALIEAVGTILAALLAAVGAVLTWVLTTRGEHAKDRREREARSDEERRARDQRVKDILTAVHGEIAAGIGAVTEQKSAEPELIRRIDALSQVPSHSASEGGTGASPSRTDPVPFSPPDDHDFVFESVRTDIALLPEEVIHEVVLYYRQARRSNAMTLGLQNPILRLETSIEGQKDYVRELMELLGQQRVDGIRALHAIERHGASLKLDLKPKRLRLVADSEDERLDRAGHDITPMSNNISSLRLD